MTINKAFHGAPLVRVATPMGGYLSGGFGREVFEEYQKLVKDKYFDNSDLKNILVREKDDIIGTSIPAVIAVNELLRKNGRKERVANLIDIQRAIAMHFDFGENPQIDLGITINDEGLHRPNYCLSEHAYSSLARDIPVKLKERLPSIRSPVLIPLTELELYLSKDIFFPLQARLKKDAIIYDNQRVLVEGGYYSPKDISNETGLPTRLGIETKERTRKLTGSRPMGRLAFYGRREFHISAYDAWLGRSSWDGKTHGRIFIVNPQETRIVGGIK